METFYKCLKKTSNQGLVIILGAFLFEPTYTLLVDDKFDEWNQGSLYNDLLESKNKTEKPDEKEDKQPN